MRHLAAYSGLCTPAALRLGLRRPCTERETSWWEKDGASQDSFLVFP